MGAGKSSMAKYLIEQTRRGVRAGFAYALRLEVLRYLDDKAKPASMPPNVGEAFDLACDAPGGVWMKPTPPHFRTLLQWWGTDFRRNRNPDYWLDQWERWFGYEPVAIVDDVRFPNEVQFIQDRGGIVWWLERSADATVSVAPGDRTHASENSIGPVDCDRIIDSNRPLIEVQRDALAFYLDLLPVHIEKLAA